MVKYALYLKFENRKKPQLFGKYKSPKIALYLKKHAKLENIGFLKNGKLTYADHVIYKKVKR